MKRILLYLTLIVSSTGIMYSQSSVAELQNDSIPEYTDLSDVVVNADRIIRTVNSITVLPTKTEKNAATDAFDLVKRLTIPKIIVRDTSISTVLGDNVAIFINGIPASLDDMRGINVSSISKVEYLDFPQDSRYLGEKHVVSIFTKDPVSGGFTKGYFKGDYADKFKESANIMSKFTYKRMVYDIILTQQFAETDKIGSNKEQLFNFNNGLKLSQKQNVIDGYSKSEKYGGTFRAIYNTPTIMISNMVGLTYNATPYTTVNYHNSIPAPEQEFESRMKTYEKSLFPSWIGNYSFVLPKNFSLTFNGETSYSRNHFNQSQKTQYAYIFDNKVKEDVFKVRSTVTVQKNMNRAGMLQLNAVYWYNYFNMDYLQNSAPTVQKESNEYVSAGLSYSLPIRYFMLYAQLGATYRNDKVSPYSLHETSPYANLAGSWNYRRNSAQLTLHYGNSTYEGAMLNPTSLQVDNYLYVQGNPDLKSSPIVSVNGYYGYSASNTLQLSFFGEYHHLSNPAVLDYVAHKDFVIANRINSGTYQAYQAAIRGDLRLLDKSLVISLTPMITGSRLTGINTGNTTAFKLNAEVFYYLKNWNFGIFYYGRDNTVNMQGTTVVTSSLYCLQVGWGNESWNVSFGMSNPFRNSWYNITESFNSPAYSYSSRSLAPSYHRRFSLAVAYTIGYGKKTSRDTIQNLENSSSAILH